MTASIIAVILESTMNFKLFAKRKEAVEGETKETMWQSMKAGFTYLKLQPIIMALLWIAFFINFLFGAFEVGYSFILIEKLKMSPQHFGLTQGAFAVGMLLLSFYLSVRKEVKYPFLVSKRGILVFGVLMASIGLPLIVPNELRRDVRILSNSYVWFRCHDDYRQYSDDGHDAKDNRRRLQRTRFFNYGNNGDGTYAPWNVIIYGFLYDIFPAQWIPIVSSLISNRCSPCSGETIRRTEGASRAWGSENGESGNSI